MASKKSKSENNQEGKPDNSVKIAVISTIGVIVTTLITALLAPVILRALEKTPTPLPVPQTTVAAIGSGTSSVLPSTAIPTKSNEPRVSNFQACESLCNGQNNSTSFSEKIKKIYAQFNYENFPSGVKYVRTWSLNGMEWIRYTCNWDGPTTGTEVLTLKEPQGLRSGTWEITIFVDDVVVLKEQITVNGNYNYWDPAGTINACHGTVD